MKLCESKVNGYLVHEFWLICTQHDISYSYGINLSKTYQEMTAEICVLHSEMCMYHWLHVCMRSYQLKSNHISGKEYATKIISLKGELLSKIK